MREKDGYEEREGERGKVAITIISVKITRY